MHRKAHRPRRLTFERLESKASPSSLMLLATAAEIPDEEIQPADEISFARNDTIQTMAGSHWSYPLPAEQLKNFLDNNTAWNPQELERWPMPSQEECDRADEMMRLDDEELQLMILGAG